MDCSAMIMLRAREAGNKLETRDTPAYGRAAMGTCRVLQALSSCTISQQNRQGCRCAVQKELAVAARIAGLPQPEPPRPCRKIPPVSCWRCRYLVTPFLTHILELLSLPATGWLALWVLCMLRITERRWQFQPVALNKDGRDAAAGSCASSQSGDAKASAVDAASRQEPPSSRFAVPL